MTDITVKVTKIITQRRISDMMVTLIEGNYITRQWCPNIYLKGYWEKEMEGGGLTDELWYAAPEIYDDKLEIEAHELEDEYAEGDEGIKVHKITLQHFIDGLQWMAENQPKHFSDLIDDNADIETADIMWQSIVLREIVYG